jgi:hypothetical protein
VSNKAVTIMGAGVGKTIITSALSSRRALDAPFFISSGGKAVRISGFTCIGGYDPNGFIHITSLGFRIDHCAFTNLTKRAIWALSTENSNGVIDHCTFTKTSGTPQGVSVFGDGDAAWNRPLSLGTTKAVCVEDCVFTWNTPADTVLDMYSGARAIFHHNTVINDGVGCHGLDSGKYRSPVSWEIYDNTFQSSVSLARFFHLRGGTGVVYNNTCTSTKTTSPIIVLSCYRATGTAIFVEYKPWGFVTGSNPYDGNTDEFGYPALDQIGAAPPTTPSNLSVTRPTNHSVQDHSAAYAWNNTLNGRRMPMGVITYPTTTRPSVADLIKENRDFYNDVPKPEYKALVYPHPLVGEQAPSTATSADLQVVH